MQEMDYLRDILVILASSILIIVLFRRMRLSPVLGYLIGGAVIGKHGYDVILDPSQTHFLGELGIVFLLFMIGLELTFERLIKMRRHVFGFGGLQLVLTTIPITLAIQHYLELESSVAMVFGAALTLSSTAIVLQVLAESQRQSTQVGRLSLSVLLMQDLAVVPLLAILPLLTETKRDIVNILGVAALKALIAIIGITILGRLFLRPMFSFISSVKSDEVYVPTTLLLVLSAAVATSNLGLSTAMGAFIAGLLIAETEYRNKVENSIMPFKSLLLGLFFMSVGMSIDGHFILDNLLNLVMAAFILLLVKGVIIFMLCKVFRFQWGASLHSSFLLSQGSEFGFVLIGLASQQEIIGNYEAQFLLMVIAITMAVTPVLSILGGYLEDRIDSLESMDANMEFKGISDLDGHVIIAGFGRVGRVVAYMLAAERINYVAVESNAALVKKARHQGFPIYHGDLSDLDTLRSVGAQRANAAILTMDDKISLRKAVKNVAVHYKNVRIMARVEDYRHGSGIRKLGATITVPATIEIGLQLGGASLRMLGIPEHEILAMKERVRQNDYSLTHEIELFRGITQANVINHLKNNEDDNNNSTDSADAGNQGKNSNNGIG
ncbi:MAG: cation:proton antiporter [Proteobacteria bacterium]|nr:cation:proton antiporter [Pseudomonadota bacterium]